MNRQEKDVLKVIITSPYINQRILGEVSGYSLGVINRSLRSLISAGYLTEEFNPTRKAQHEYERNTTRNAVILAAGFGMRMVPINLVSPKGLIEVNGETLIERLIKQLNEVGIKDITVVVGFMKEAFDYLIDKYDVKLVVNTEYATKNNLASLNLVRDGISNTYVVPSDIWCKDNPFDRHEMYSWYMVSESLNENSEVRVNRKMELVRVREGSNGNSMVGIAYIAEEDSKALHDRINIMNKYGKHGNDFWESALYDKDKMFIQAKVVPSGDVIEIDTYEQLRELDGASNHLKSDAMDIIGKVFNTSYEKIVDISVLKKGMTNRSFSFNIDGEKYIMRIPGEGTDALINRAEEVDVFRTISGKGLCDDPIYINPQNGFKITKFLNGIRVCDPENKDDLRKCMKLLREFHNMKLKVNHIFDIFAQIEFYETLWGDQKSVFADYEETKENVFSLKSFIDSFGTELCLTHIDAVPDNFLFYDDEEGNEKLQLTDWEYSGMQDPHLDIAMFCIYSMYDKAHVDRLIDIYFVENCGEKMRTKIYCYIAVAGLLWSNWCEYKRSLGIEFGEYSMKQYRYAKDYYKIAKSRISDGKVKDE